LPVPDFLESLPFTFPSFLLRYFSRGISKERCAAVPRLRCTTRKPVNYCASPNFFGVRIMFKIIKYRNHSGKIQMTIETDVQMAADFCRFFGTINKFVDLFNYRVRSAKSFDLYQKTAPHKMALHKKNIADQLERFRSMSGTRIERVRILKEMRVSNGERVTLDQIDVELRHAKQYDKEDKLLKIKGLLDSGKLLNDIVKTIDLPKTTITRMIKQLRPPETPPAEPALAPENVSRSEEA
jgi:hypothetical protein